MTEQELLALKREKNRIKVAKYRARKAAREQGLELPPELEYTRGYQDEDEDEGYEYEETTISDWAMWVGIGVMTLLFIGVPILSLVQSKKQPANTTEEPLQVQVPLQQ